MNMFITVNITHTKTTPPTIPKAPPAMALKVLIIGKL